MQEQMPNQQQLGGFTQVNQLYQNQQFYPPQGGYSVTQDYTLPSSIYNAYAQMPNNTIQSNGLKQVRVKSGFMKNRNSQYGQAQQQSVYGMNGKKNQSRPGSAQVARLNAIGGSAKNQMSTLGMLQNQAALQNNFFKQNSVSKNMLQNLYKESLNDDSGNLRLERNKLQGDNLQLKTQVRVQDKELKRKDAIIKQLMDRLNQENSLTQTQIMQISNLSQAQQNSVKYKSKIKQLKNDLILKQEEIMNLNRNLKYTKIQELEAEIQELQNETVRLNQTLILEVNKPRVDPSIFQALQVEYQKQQQAIKVCQDQASQLVEIITDKESTISKRDKKIQKMNERLKILREKVKTQVKKIKVLTSKVMDSEKDKVAMLSRFGTSANKIGRNNNHMNNGHNESIRTKRSNSGSPRPNNSPRIGGGKNNMNSADWFEKYVIEKTKNERLVKQIFKFDPHLDINQLYKEDVQATEQSDENNQDFPIIQVIFNNEAKTFEYTNNIEDLKTQIQQEFQLDNMNFMLKNQNDEPIEQLTYQNSNEPIIVLVQILEEQYEEEDFDEYVENFEDAVKLEEIQLLLQELKLKLQIKKVKQNKALKYVLKGLSNDQGKKLKSISIQKLSQQLTKKIKFNDQESTLVARYLIEQPNQNGQIVFNIQTEIPRGQLKKKFTQSIGEYHIYNGLAITSLLKRLTSILEDYKNTIEENLIEKDETESGEVPIQMFMQCVQESGAPELDEEIKDFLLFIVLRQSKSLREINYYSFLEIFDDDYLIQTSPHEDKQYFNESSDTSEDELPSKQPLNIQNGQTQEASGYKGIEINEEELYLTVDETLSKIFTQFDINKNLTKQLFPRIRDLLNIQAFDDQSSQVYYLLQNDFVKFVKDLLQITDQNQSTDNEKKVQCLLHILVREDLQGIILYDEFKQLLLNYAKKEKIFLKSVQQGIRYDLINQEILQFLQHVKQITVDIEETGVKGKSLTGEILQKVLINQKIVSGQGRESTVLVVDFETMLDHLFMKFSIRCPPMKVQYDLRMLLSLDQRYPDMVLVNKLNKILTDLDQIQVNILKMQRDPVYLAYIKSQLPQPKPNLRQNPSQNPQSALKQATFNEQQQLPVKKGVSFNQKQTNAVADEDDDVYDDNEEEPAPIQKQTNPKILQQNFNQNQQNSQSNQQKPQQQQQQQTKKKESEDEFQYDTYRKKFTKKAEEIPSDDEDLPNDSNSMKEDSDMPESDHNNNNHQQAKKIDQTQQNTQLNKLMQQQQLNSNAQISNKVQQQEEIQKVQAIKSPQKSNQGLDEKDKNEPKEEKMDFQFDPYRKKFTVKAEEIEEDEDLEQEDFIEDNYDF
eukprot:403363052